MISRTLCAIALAAAPALLAGCASGPAATTVAAPPGAPFEGESSFLSNPIQLTFADMYVKAGEQYFDPSVSWVIYQAVPLPPPGEEPSANYLMYVAKLKKSGERIVGIEEPILLSPPGSANTCGWFHPTLPGVVLFGSTLVPPNSQNVPGYSRDRSRYVWEFPNEMELCTSTVSAIVEDLVTDPKRKAELLARPDVDKAVPLFERDGYDAEGSWSSDGRWILYTAVDPRTGDGDLYAYICATGERRPLRVAPGYDGGPFISPDGRYICYRSDRRGNDLLQLFVSELRLDRDGLPTGISNEYQLTDNEHVQWAPFWHPSGDYMIYASSELGHFNYEVYAIAFDRRNPTVRHPTFRITDAEGFDGLPVFSPDGKHMIWTAQRGSDRNAQGRASSQLWIAGVNRERPLGMKLASEVAPKRSDARRLGPDPVSSALAESSADVRRYDEHLVTLANPALEGRLPGTPGIALAESYIERCFDWLGLEPAFPGDRATPRASFAQPFEMNHAADARGEASAADTPIAARNIGAVLPGRGALADEWIVVGAHHDHLGYGRFGSTTGPGRVHPGADDNASGVAGVLLMAERLAEDWGRLGRTSRRSILFLTFSGEESGQLGSRRYVEAPIAPIDRHVLMVNFDMIGRIADGRIDMHGATTGAGLRELVEREAADCPLAIRFTAAPPARSDHVSFLARRVPVLFPLVAEFSDDYHSPRDESWKVDRTAATAVVELMTRVVRAAALRPVRFAFVAPDATNG